jgi:hypothetical protein
MSLGMSDRSERIISTVLFADWCASPQMVMVAHESMVHL